MIVEILSENSKLVCNDRDYYETIMIKQCTNETDERVLFKETGDLYLWERTRQMITTVKKTTFRAFTIDLNT